MHACSEVCALNVAQSRSDVAFYVRPAEGHESLGFRACLATIESRNGDDVLLAPSGDRGNCTLWNLTTRMCSDSSAIDADKWRLVYP